MESTYTYLLQRKSGRESGRQNCDLRLKPDRGGRREARLVEIHSEWPGSVEDGTHLAEAIGAMAEVGNAVPAVGAREVENIWVSGLVPGQLLWCDQLLTEDERGAEDLKW